jgi:hypothetical protein
MYVLPPRAYYVQGENMFCESSGCAITNSGCGKERAMLIVDGTMVYEIDEECISKRTPPKECGVMEELEKQRGVQSTSLTCQKCMETL